MSRTKLPYIYGVAFDMMTGKWACFNETTGERLSLHDTQARAYDTCRKYERIRCARIIRNPLRDLAHVAI